MKDDTPCTSALRCTKRSYDDAWTHDGKPCIDIDTREDDLEDPYFPNFSANTKVIVPVSEDYEPKEYRKALAEEGWEVVDHPGEVPLDSPTGTKPKDKHSVGTAGTKTPVARR